MTRKPKPRGVVARFLAGESVRELGLVSRNTDRVEAILRRALAKKGGKR